MSEHHPLPPFDPAIVGAVMVAGRQVSDVLCDRWTLLVLLSAQAGMTRFSEFREQWGISNRMLGARLAMLEQQEVMVRLAYSRRPLRHSYHLTHMGLALFDIFAAMQHWERVTADGSTATGLRLSHSLCGHADVSPTAHCAHCHAELDATDVDIALDANGQTAVPDRTSTFRRSAARGQDEAGALLVPMPRALEIYGDKWSIEVIMCAFSRVSTFGDMQRFTGMSSNILADRLARLVAGDVLRQEPVESDARRLAYKLTARGRALFPVVMAMWEWADTWLKDRVRAPLKVHHRACGKPLRLLIRCDHCAQPLERHHSQLVL